MTRVALLLIALICAMLAQPAAADGTVQVKKSISDVTLCLSIKNVGDKPIARGARVQYQFRTLQGETVRGTVTLDAELAPGRSRSIAVLPLKASSTAVIDPRGFVEQQTAVEEK